MKRTVFDAYRRLGMPDALSWINVAAILALQVSGSAISSLVNFEGRTLLFFAVRMTSLLFFAAVIFIGRLALNRWAQSRPQPLITLATFVIGLITATAAFDALLVFTGLTPEFVLGRRLATSTLGVLTLQILTSVLVTYTRDFSTKNAELLRVAEELEETRNAATARISRRREQLISEIRHEINSELSKFGSKSAAQDAHHLRALIDDVVRPISYSLAREVPTESQQAPAVTPTPVDWRSVLRNTLKGNPFHWVATPLMFAAISALFLISTFQLRGLATLLALVLTVGVCNVVGHSLWHLLPTSLSSVARGVIFTIVASTIGLLTAPLLSLFTPVALFEPLPLISWVFNANLASWVAALVSRGNAMLRKTNEALGTTVDELRREVIALNNAQRQLQQTISRVMHGPVQQAITSALIKVQKNPEPENHDQLAEILRLKIFEALDSLTAAAPVHTDFSDFLAELEELWSGAVHISADVTGEDIAKITADTRLAHTLSELIHEGCSNAIRHGDATRIDIAIRVDTKTRSVDLQIANNGSPVPADARVGLGTDLFHESSLEWSRVHGDGRVVVHATLPLTKWDAPHSSPGRNTEG